MPRYNVLLRDDKSFPLIHLTADHDFPQLTKHRGARDKDGSYFGPFASAGAVNRTLVDAAEGVSAALVQRQRLRQPHPPVPAATRSSGAARPASAASAARTMPR